MHHVATWFRRDIIFVPDLCQHILESGACFGLSYLSPVFLGRLADAKAWSEEPGIRLDCVLKSSVMAIRTAPNDTGHEQEGPHDS